MGRKRKDASLARPIAVRKRRRTEHGSSDWASLPTDIVELVTARLLDGGNVKDYVCFRAVCSGWRACTEPMDLRADSWIALCDGDAVWPADAREIAMFHTRTARRLRVCLPSSKLRGYRIVGFSNGLLVLMHKGSGEVRVLHPLTRVAVDFPSLATVYREAIRYKSFFRAMSASVCNAASCCSSIAVVLWFPYRGLVVAADAGSDRWDILHRGLVIKNTLVFQGRLYATTGSFEIVKLYPPTTGPLAPPAVVARLLPNNVGGQHHPSDDIYIVESGGRMLLVIPTRSTSSSANSSTQLGFAIYAVDDLNDNNGGGSKLTSVTSLGDRVLFLGKNACLSVSANNLPSLSRNSIYFSVGSHPVLLMHSLATSLSEEYAAECQIHDRNERTRPSVRPFTIADHLLTFCHPREWTRGLMFHEYHVVPKSFTELRKRITAKESQQRFRHKPWKQKQVESTLKMAEFLLATELKDNATSMSLVESNTMLAESEKNLVVEERIRKMKDALIRLVCRPKEEES